MKWLHKCALFQNGSMLGEMKADVGKNLESDGSDFEKNAIVKWKQAQIQECDVTKRSDSKEGTE